MKLHFIKMHALGNDFILIDDRFARLKKISRLSKKLCSRRFGIGADQLLLLCKSKTSDFKMRIFNADSSEVEMCGNGIRCLGKYIWDKNLKTQYAVRSTQKHLAIETLAGIIHLQKTGKLIKVDMGEPILEPEKIPINQSSELKKKNASPIINYPLKIKGKTFKITCVSMGNPHAITVVKDVHSVPLIHYGPIIENYRFFPNRTNVEFIQILNRKNIRMRVWERGAGETMACGTGASAAGVASALLGLTERKVTVHLPGGKLLIEWSKKNNHVYMTGPAVKVFEGIINVR
ncbi:MAG: diaminopimelate epimerase [Nitrospirae bacterium]|nr:diaminopimelate epimerase [Nitrospirota bacterium]